MRKLFLGLPLNKTKGVSVFLPIFGQMVSLELVWTVTNASEAESFPIACSDGVVDWWCREGAASTIPFQHSDWTMVDGVCTPVNYATTYLDASALYGADEATSALLRTFEGGQMYLTEDGLPCYDMPGVSLDETALNRWMAGGGG